jgi:hypothetical protein
VCVVVMLGSSGEEKTHKNDGREKMCGVKTLFRTTNKKKVKKQEKQKKKKEKSKTPTIYNCLF